MDVFSADDLMKLGDLVDTAFFAPSPALPPARNLRSSMSPAFPPSDGQQFALPDAWSLGGDFNLDELMPLSPKMTAGPQPKAGSPATKHPLGSPATKQSRKRPAEESKAESKPRKGARIAEPALASRPVNMYESQPAELSACRNDLLKVLTKESRLDPRTSAALRWVLACVEMDEPTLQALSRAQRVLVLSIRNGALKQRQQATSLLHTKERRARA